MSKEIPTIKNTELIIRKSKRQQIKHKSNGKTFDLKHKSMVFDERLPPRPLIYQRLSQVAMKASSKSLQSSSLLVRVVGHVLNVHILVQMRSWFRVLVVSVLLTQISLIDGRGFWVGRVHWIVVWGIVVWSVAQAVIWPGTSGDYVCWRVVLLCATRVIWTACSVRWAW